VVDHFNTRLKLLTEKIGIEVFVVDFKRNRNICKFCNKKCSNCDLPKIFDTAFEDFFAEKYNEVKFEVYLKNSLEIEYLNEDKGISGDPTIHDCLKLFTEPE
jgi:hypothetical protein